MDLKEMKKVLAGVCAASLLSGGSLAYAGAETGQGGTKPGEGGTEPQKKEAGKSG